MNTEFSKYHGAGNDFVMLDGRETHFRLDTGLVRQICDRHMGIGGDGLIVIKSHEDLDFEMQYFNADGHLGSMCGNGGRCAAAFSRKLGISGKKMRFLASDGVHEAEVVSKRCVELKMQDVETVRIYDDHCILDTGSPHYVRIVDDLKEIDVPSEGRNIRNTPPFATSGINVNFVQVDERHISVRTYERGVEDETLACGTGVTAVALALAEMGRVPSRGTVSIATRGGHLDVRFAKNHGTYEDIWLIGPAREVFCGGIDLMNFL